jgi:hypothetical protein
MTGEERELEATDELIEDLEAPAESQGDVVGGAITTATTAAGTATGQSVTCIPPPATRCWPPSALNMTRR